MAQPKEIRAIHKKHKLFYELLGGAVVLIICILIGTARFGGENQDYWMNLFTEGMGIAATVFIINRWYAHRNQEKLKRRLVREAGSPSNDIALLAVGWLHDEGWLTGDRGVLQGANLSEANLQRAKLSTANLQEANLMMADLQEANLSEANLQEANLVWANLRGTNLSRANLQKAELDQSIFLNTNLNNANLRGAQMIDVNLQDTSLYKADLQGANMLRADLREAGWLNMANLEGTKLNSANLRGVSLENMNLRGAELYMADLREAILSGTNLQKANLLGADLRGAKIRFREIRIEVFSGEGPPDDYDTFEEIVYPATALQGATLPNGELYESEARYETMPKFTDPKHPEFPKTVKEINEIRRRFEQGDLP